ncbi:hypothetical protein MHU86_17248 [Fragilaria crotonensis]|nr:hypothetical protein MHU86_17248 [Fragilaria crotonensis]
MSNSGVAVDIEGDMDGGKSWLSIYPLINMTKQPGPLRLREMPVPPVTFWSTTLPLLAERLQFANADPNRIREFSIRQCDGTCESITIILDTAVMPKLKRVDVNYSYTPDAAISLAEVALATGGTCSEGHALCSKCLLRTRW